MSWVDTRFMISTQVPGSAGEILHSVFAADIATPDGFEILRAGKYVRGGREIPVTEADLDAAVANFKRWQDAEAQVPVDYDHSFASTGDSRAAGWYTQLVRVGKSLFAKVNWTDKAKEAIESGEYRYFSPEFTSNWQNEKGEDEGFTILAGALTNRPFLRGITQVSMNTGGLWTAGGTTNTTGGGTYTVQLEPTVLTWAADDNHAEMTKPSEDTTSAIESEETETVTMSQEEVDSLKGRAAEAASLKDQLDEMGRAVEGLKKSLADEKFSTCFSQALREGRIDAKDETREIWSKRFEKFGHDEAKELLFERPAETIPMGERGHGEDDPSNSSVPDGVDAERFSLHNRAEKLAADEDIDYSEAVMRLASQEA